MRRATAGLLAFLAGIGHPGVHAEPSDPQSLFDEAVRVDLAGDSNAASAYRLFLRAADRGLAAAEFNVAVMLDSGRGVVPDQSQAALWYARAAARGSQRAAFNLGQLYELGEGTTRNVGLARAWFLASALPAGAARAAKVPVSSPKVTFFTAPTCADPGSGLKLPAKLDGVELVWTALEQPGPVRFFVEVRDEAGQEVYAAYTDVSAALVPIARQEGRFTWRVSTVAIAPARYVSCEWAAFSLTPS